jgi:hypothetical protein
MMEKSFAVDRLLHAIRCPLGCRNLGKTLQRAGRDFVLHFFINDIRNQRARTILKQSDKSNKMGRAANLPRLEG